VIVPPEKGYGPKGKNEIPVKTCFCHLIFSTFDAYLTYILLLFEDLMSFSSESISILTKHKYGH
jgi:hypothetical protein